MFWTTSDDAVLSEGFFGKIHEEFSGKGKAEPAR